MTPPAPKFAPPGAGEPLHGPGGEVIVPKATPADTNDQFSLAEYLVMPGSGPPLHVHSREDESFWILQGRIAFAVAGQRIDATAGSFVFAPRGIPHTFRNVSDAPAKMLLMVTPPANFQAFLAAIFAPADDGSPPSEAAVIERIGRRAPDHGITILGPSPL
jgi:quercetin dioxygenase-like cupin family protein